MPVGYSGLFPDRVWGSNLVPGPLCGFQGGKQNWRTSLKRIHNIVVRTATQSLFGGQNHPDHRPISSEWDLQQPSPAAWLSGQLYLEVRVARSSVERDGERGALGTVKLSPGSYWR